jgi:hypothetical protein
VKFVNKYLQNEEYLHLQQLYSFNLVLELGLEGT